MLDPQMKRGLLEVCVLAALSRGDSYGYQIIKDMSAAVTVSESTLYPILRRLEAGGNLSSYSVEHGGRLRKFYRITEAGRQHLRDFVQSWPEIRAMYRFVEEGMDHD